MDYDKEHNQFSFYKSVCSDVRTRYEKFDRTDPDINVILYELGIIDNLHHSHYKDTDRDEY